MVEVGLALLTGAVSLGTGAVAAGVVLWCAHRRRTDPELHRPAPTDTVILTEGDRIVDATPSARALLSMLGDDGWSADRLQALLAREFPGLGTALAGIVDRRRVELASQDRTRTLEIRAEGRRRRFVIADCESRLVTLDRSTHAAIEDELATLRDIGDAIAHPVWQQRPGGRITWANAAYTALAANRDGAAAETWPPPPLFRIDEIVISGGGRLRLAEPGPDAGPDTGWFDCHVHPLPTGLLVSAVPADAQIRAENSLREFVQTFSQTFANLTVGLAVFNRQRHLMLFNPALTDLTQVPVDVLLGQPTLHTFLDALRARRIMPEPKKPTFWRERVATLERAAIDGSLSELWHLSANRTYRVTGRPQPDGAFALLVEDISDEIGLTRRFRDQIETGHAVLNAVEDAIAVFDRSGILTLSNTVYDALWGLASGDGMAELTAADAMRTWLAATRPTPVWGDARSFLDQETERSEWSESVRLRDGRWLRATFTPLPNGASLVRFAERPSPASDRAGSAPGTTPEPVEIKA